MQNFDLIRDADGLFANDIGAMSCLIVAQMNGIHVPEQLKIISNVGNSEGIKYLKVNEEFEQEQYEVVKLAKPFTGVLVGTQKVFTKKHFKCENDFVDYADNLLTQIKPYTKKEDLQFVAKVYFKKGQSRLVPLEMVELIND